MQQHTGQHLISSIFDKIGIETLSWWMAENEVDKVGVSYIELDTKETCHEQLEHVEDECNQAIRDHLEVKTLVYAPGSEELQNAKTRGLPDDTKVQFELSRLVTLIKTCVVVHTFLTYPNYK